MPKNSMLIDRDLNNVINKITHFHSQLEGIELRYLRNSESLPPTHWEGLNLTYTLRVVMLLDYSYYSDDTAYDR